MESLAELDVVVLLEDCGATDADNPHIVPKGSCGTVVGVLGGGACYIVEFEEPLHALLDLSADVLAVVDVPRPSPEA